MAESNFAFLCRGSKYVSAKPELDYDDWKQLHYYQ